MATPTYATALSQINNFIVANGNNEITANVLNPVLKIILDFANNNIGDLTTLTTDETNTIVEAINSLKQNFEDLVNNGIQLHTGYDDPNVTPPADYNYGDFYMQLDSGDDSPIQLWQWNGFEWKDSSSNPATNSDNIENNSDVVGQNVTDALNTLNTEKAEDSDVVHKTGDTFAQATDFDDILSQDPNTQEIEKRVLKPEASRLNSLLTPIYSWGDSLTLGAGYNPYPNQLNGLSRFEVTNKGVGGNTSTQIKDRFLAEPGNFSKSVIIWAGRNNYLDPTTVKADIATMISNLGHDRYLVVGIINGNYALEYVNQSGWTAINSLNNDLKALYGSKFVDIRPYLVSLHDQSAQDLIDFANDVPPTSLRVDNIHFGSVGYGKIAEFINQRLGNLYNSNGYLQSKDFSYYTNVFGISNQASVNQSANFRIDGIGIARRFITRDATSSDFSSRHLIMQNNSNLNRISLGLTDTEAGSNSGSNFALVTYNDAGDVFSNPVTIFRNTGNMVLKSSAINAVDTGFKLDVTGTTRLSDATLSAIPLTIGGGATAGWIFQNSGSPTNRIIIKGYFNGTQTINIDPSTSGFSYFNANRYGFGTSTDNGVDRVQVSGNVSGSVAAASANHFMRKGEVDTALGLKANNLLTGYVSGAGTVAGTDTVLQAIQKLNGNIALNARPYKVYTALINQTGTSDPVATVMENTLGVLTFGYTSTGVYTITSSSLFTADKTITFVGGNSTGVPVTIKLQRTSSSNISFLSFNGAGSANALSDTAIEIRVYN